MLFGGLFSSLESSVDFIDSMVDEAFSESALRITSNENGSRIQDVIAPANGIEPLLCVPRILTLLLSSLEENWHFDTSMELSYDLNQVLPVIDFFNQNNRLPAGIQTPLGLSILYYILSNLKVSFIPMQHYSAFLHTALLFDASLQVHLLQTILRDLSLFEKVIMDRIITLFSQLFMACGCPCCSSPVDNPEEVSPTLHAILHFLIPSVILIDRPQTQGELDACEEMLAVVVTHPSEVLQEVRKEIETANAILSDKKQRVSGIMQLVGVSVDIADTQGMSLRLLKQLWSKTVVLYCQAHNQPIPEFSPISPYWKLLGFQRETPLTDFRGGGVLSLIQLEAFVSQCPEFMLDVMSCEDKAKQIPVAIACINLSIMLVKQIGLFNCDESFDAMKLSQLPVWKFASTPDFLNQVGAPRSRES